MKYFCYVLSAVRAGVSGPIANLMLTGAVPAAVLDATVAVTVWLAEVADVVICSAARQQNAFVSSFAPADIY